jgi:hypothetical protein
MTLAVYYENAGLLLVTDGSNNAHTKILLTFIEVNGKLR